jgi:hypothetical protein
LIAGSLAIGANIARADFLFEGFEVPGKDPYFPYLIGSQFRFELAKDTGWCHMNRLS